MTCNAIRYALSAIFLAILLPLQPDETPSSIPHILKDEATTDPDAEDKNMKASKQSADPNIVFQRLVGPYSSSIDKAKAAVWFWGLLLGFLNFCAAGFQQWGLSLTSANKLALIAGLNLFLTPIFSLIIPSFKQNAKPTMTTWIAVFVSCSGIFMLSDLSYSSFEISLDEMLMLISAVFWSLHIIYTDIGISYVDTMSMMCVQFGFLSFLFALMAFWLEPQEWMWNHMYSFSKWLCLLAITGTLGFCLMAFGQNYSPPTHAAVIISLEGPFSLLSSYVFLGAEVSFQELFGCILILTGAIILRGLPYIKEKHASLTTESLMANNQGNGNDLQHVY